MAVNVESFYFFLLLPFSLGVFYQLVSLPIEITIAGSSRLLLAESSGKDNPSNIEKTHSLLLRGLMG